jgi:hypothetical protein
MSRHLLKIRREKIVPLIKQGFVRANADLLGRSRSTRNGISTWYTARQSIADRL